MRNLFYTVALLLTTTFCASQGFTHGLRSSLPSSLLSQTQEKNSGVQASVPQETLQEDTGKSKSLESQESREVQTRKQDSFSENKTSQNITYSNSSETPEESLRSMPSTLHQKESPNARPLSQNRGMARFTAPQLQYSNRTVTRLSQALPAGGEVSDKMDALAKAIAKAEGFGRKGKIPTRYHNAGDLKAVRGFKYEGQVGIGKGRHVIFATDADGWKALNRQIEMIAEGLSQHYSVDMTLQQMAKKYAGNWRVFAKNLSHSLGVPQSTTLAEYLGRET
jgi:hypothetical protein